MNQHPQSGYPAAVERFLPQVLGMMISQQMLDNNSANQVSSNRNNWIMQFVQGLPQGQQIQESQFKQLLGNFISSMVRQPVNNGFSNTGFAPQNTGFGGFPNNPPQQQQLSFGDALRMNNGPRGFSNPQQPAFSNAAPVIDRNIYSDNSEPEDTGFIITDEHVADEKEQRLSYEPAWVNDSGIITVSEHIFEQGTIKRAIYPADKIEKAFTLYSVKFPGCAGNVGKFADILNNIDAGGAYIGNVEFNKVQVIKLPHEDTIKHFYELAVIGTGDGDLNTKLHAIVTYLDGQSRSVFNVFERLILDKFNLALTARTLQDTSNVGLEIKLNKLDSILELSPIESSVGADALVKIAGYSDAFNKTINSIIDWLSSITISACSNEIRTGAESGSGMAGIGEYIKLVSSYSDNSAAFKESYSVIKYTENVIITNMDFTKSNCISQALTDTGYSVYDIATCALDYAIKDLSNTSGPIKVYDIHSNHVVYGWTLDNELVCASS